METHERVKLRVWCEFLPFEESAQPDVVSLLRRFDVQPILAVRPDSDLDALAHSIRVMQASRLKPFIWPLLSVEDGYWPGEENSELWWLQTKLYLKELNRAWAMPAGIAVDLEPPIQQVRRLARYVPGLDVLRLIAENLDGPRFERSLERWNEVCEEIHRMGLSTLSVAFSAVAHDLKYGESIWQDLLESPWSGVRWGSHGVMAYSSLVTGYSRGLLSARVARHVHHELLTSLVGRFGQQAHVSLGLTGQGVLGNEPVYREPQELAEDAAAARAAGVRDIGIFSLEGILSQTHPEAWFEAVFKLPETIPPATRRSRLIRSSARAARHLAKWARKST